jgi:N-acetylneuraminate synthase/N,N'-diacetyllegionaminate synthase
MVGMVKGRALRDKVKIGARPVGAGEPCFIIAEAGVNHNGRVALAKKLIDVAAAAGADAVKFQTFRTENVITAGAAKARYQEQSTGADESQLEMIKKLELSQADFKKLSDYARRQGIIFLSTPFDKGSVDFLDKLGVPAFKIASGEITNFPLLQYIARKKKPVILSTGMSTLGEIADALDVIKAGGTGEIILLHCVSCYPARIQDTNLRVMETLRNAFKLPVGLSDHSPGVTIPVAAAALGACVIEKHFTLDKKLPGPDHKASLEPEELKAMVRAIRDVAGAMGSGKKRLTAEEKENKKAARRSIVAGRDIPAGTIITEAMLAIKRPGTGIEPKRLATIIGRKTKENIRRDELISLRKLL